MVSRSLDIVKVSDSSKAVVVSRCFGVVSFPQDSGIVYNECDGQQNHSRCAFFKTFIAIAAISLLQRMIDNLLSSYFNSGVVLSSQFWSIYQKWTESFSSVQ